MIAAVVTTYNEQDTILVLVRKLLRKGLVVIVVDDQSTDDTVLEATVGGALIVQTSERAGIGPSLMLGWRHALELGATAVIQIDAGGSHKPDDFHNLMAEEHGLDDIVIGSRFTKGSTYSGRPLRALMSRAMALACSLLFGQWHTDWTSGYRLFTRHAIEVLLEHDYLARMHGWQIETLAYAIERGLKIDEAPISYTAGRSAFSWKVGLEALGVLLRGVA